MAAWHAGFANSLHSLAPLFRRRRRTVLAVCAAALRAGLTRTNPPEAWVAGHLESMDANGWCARVYVAMCQLWVRGGKGFQVAR